MKEKTKKMYFPSQRDSEEVFLLLRQHWFVYVPVLLILGFMSLPLVAALFYWVYVPESVATIIGDAIIIIGSAYALAILALFLFVFVDYYLDVNIVTNQRIVDIEQNGFFQRKISELSLDQVEDVSATVNGFFPTLLHYGDLHIQTAGSLPNFSFTSIPHPYRISKIILNLHDAAGAGSKQKSDQILSEIRTQLKGLASSSIRTSELSTIEDDNVAFGIMQRKLDPEKQGRILLGIEDDKRKAIDGSSTIKVESINKSVMPNEVK